MWSLYVGRPSGINDQNISMSLPQIPAESSKSRFWHPTTLESAPSVSRDEASSNGFHDAIEACTIANISLGMMMNKLSKTV
jgi:hypothetical protein